MLCARERYKSKPQSYSGDGNFSCPVDQYFKELVGKEREKEVSLGFFREGHSPAFPIFPGSIELWLQAEGRELLDTVSSKMLGKGQNLIICSIGWS